MRLAIGNLYQVATAALSLQADRVSPAQEISPHPYIQLLRALFHSRMM